jgi:hypothetical protein
VDRGGEPHAGLEVSGAVALTTGRHRLARSSGPELCFDRWGGGVDHLARSGDSGRNGLVAIAQGGHELGRLGVLKDADPEHGMASATQAELEKRQSTVDSPWPP